MVHDKASYMVNNKSERLQRVFAAALQEAGFASWLGNATTPTTWLMAKWGDVYLHETVISHIRRLLETDFASDRLDESLGHFAGRMSQLADHMNSKAFDAGGGGLGGLADDLRGRCQQVIDKKGERLPH